MNRAIIIGRLVTDVKLHQEKEEQIAKFSIENNGEIFFIKLKGNKAEAAHDYLMAGDLCCVEGNIPPNKLKTIVAERLTFLACKKVQERKRGEQC